MTSQKDDSILKAVSVVVLAVIGVVILVLLLSGLTNGFNLQYGMGFGLTASTVITGLIKLLAGVFVIALIVGIGFWAYQLITKNDGTQKSESEANSKGDCNTEKASSEANIPCEEIVHKTCAQCLKEIQDDWKLCPYCGHTTENQSYENEV